MAHGTKENRAEGDVDRIVREKFFPSTKKGIFVDVGAATPDFISVSALFRAIGWRVIAVEPNPEFSKLHKERGYEVLEFACGNRDEDDVEFCVVNSHGHKYEDGSVSYESFSSLGIKESYADLKSDLDITRIRVNLRRLDTLLQTYASDVDLIDILSIDVEGWELEVLDGLNVSKYQPKVMIIENLFNEERYNLYMGKLNYVLWKYIYPNDVYVRPEMLSKLDICTTYVRQKLSRNRKK